MSVESSLVENLHASFTPSDNWGEKDLETVMASLEDSIQELLHSYERDYDRDSVLSDVGTCLKWLEAVCICHKSHLHEAVILDKLNC